jgi:hypothetical protein
MASHGGVAAKSYLTSLGQPTTGVTLVWAKGYQYRTVKGLELFPKDLRTEKGHEIWNFLSIPPVRNDRFIQISSNNRGIQ